MLSDDDDSPPQALQLPAHAPDAFDLLFTSTCFFVGCCFPEHGIGAFAGSLAPHTFVFCFGGVPVAITALVHCFFFSICVPTDFMPVGECVWNNGHNQRSIQFGLSSFTSTFFFSFCTGCWDFTGGDVHTDLFDTFIGAVATAFGLTVTWAGFV